jgi:hypothetical protein
MLGVMPLDKDRFEKNNFSVDFIQSPPGLDLPDTYTVQNNQPWFLKVSTEKIYPDSSGNAGYSIEISNSTDSLTGVNFANTLYPVGNESLFLPKSDFTPPDRVMIPSKSPEWIEYSPSQTPQKIPVYANYSASPAARVEILSVIGGFNGWAGPSTLGKMNPRIDGGGNEYMDSYSWILYGDSIGWHNVNGEFKSERCVYPNLEFPAGR